MEYIEKCKKRLPYPFLEIVNDHAKCYNHNVEIDKGKYLGYTLEYKHNY